MSQRTPPFLEARDTTFSLRSRFTRRLRVPHTVFVLAAFLPLLVAPLPVRAQMADTTFFRQLKYRHLGPDGNRASAVVGEPGNPLVAYVGAASGGVWKTEDGGANWTPVFDDQPAQSIGALSVAPSDPNEVWAGTGETFYIRLATSVGNGIYRSTDAGDTWTHLGLERTGRIARIVVHPRKPEVVYVCATGHGYAPQGERGVFRTTDGGATWKKVLFVNDSTGCSDLAMDPRDPATLFAGMWQVEIDTWGLHTGGKGSGVYVTHDGGDTWKELSGHGLPPADTTLGKAAVAVAPSDPDRVYALLQRWDPSLYRSDDGGKSWKLVNRNHSMAERGPYYTRMAVSPSDPDRLYFASVRFGMSRDGGRTLADDPPRGGGDNHDIWIDPTDARRIMVAHDGGASITLNGGRSFQRVVLPIAQMYHVYTDTRVPYYVYGNRQDGYSYRGPSNSRRGGGFPIGAWHSVGGCESGFAIPDTVSNRIVWSGCYDGGLERYDLETGHARDVRVWPEAGYGVPPVRKKYRWNWTFPIALSPSDANRVYVGSQVVHVTSDGGQSWRVLSPDLTRNDTTHQQGSGGISTDNLNTFSAATLSAIAESPVQAGVIWTGSYDGLVHVTRDGGGSWTDATGNIPGLPSSGRVSNLEPSHREAGKAYLAVDLQELGDFDPYVYVTEDYGAHWRRIDAGIPRSPFSMVHVVREDPARPGLLFVGTENGVFFTPDEGGVWHRLQSNLPRAPVSWLDVQPHFHDLVVATYGRGIWILDDITPLEQMADGRPVGRHGSVSAADELRLFAPRDAYRFRPIRTTASTPSHVQGRNPPYGASLDFFVPKGLVDEAATDTTARGKKQARLVVLDASGDTVRTLKVKPREGINRIWWDLRYEDVRHPKLRAPPPSRSWVRLPEKDWRPVVSWDLDLSQRGPLVSPGAYTITLVLGGDTLSRTLTVLKDPSTEGTEADIRAQTELALRIRADMDSTATMIDRLEWIRKQLADLGAMLAESGLAVPDSTLEALRRQTRATADSAAAAESHLFDVNLTGAREDAFRHPNRLWSRYSALLHEVAEAGADFPPTDPQREVFDLLHERFEEGAKAYGEILNGPLAKLRRRLRRVELPFVLPAGSEGVHDADGPRHRSAPSSTGTAATGCWPRARPSGLW
ncbi:MAG: WD40/YVTN/BNR-like repeat-containing protein [Gemmatimonadota bacterium]